MRLDARAGRIEKDIRELANFSEEGPGVTRFSYTDQHRAARVHIVDAMKKAGLTVREDALGNIIGRREGKDPLLPAIAVGSHFDSVRNGGMFDGTAGVVSAIEVARVLHDAEFKNRHPMEFIAIVEEEGSRFNSGMLGGRAIAGLVEDEDLDRLKDADGVSVREAVESFGLDPSGLSKCARDRDSLRAFIELHIEQGPILEQENVDIGVVTSIVGIRTLGVSFTGRSDHAGTTPMHMRQDALIPASSVVQQIHEFVSSLEDGSVATVGHMTVSPGGINQVPGEVNFTVDLRSPNEASLVKLEEKVRSAVASFAAESGVAGSTEVYFSMAPVPLASDLINSVRAAASHRNLSHRDMPSGAGHDSMFIAQVTDVGMVFVPSKDGRSHVPEEWSEFDDLRKGTDVVLSVLEVLDG